MTAATVTGPAHAPRPTSSIPHTTWSPASQNFRSSRRVGPERRVGGGSGHGAEPSVRTQHDGRRLP